MPSDTFAAGIEAAARVVEDHGKTWGLAYRSMTDELARAIRRLTPTDTDTAIPAGEVEDDEFAGMTVSEAIEATRGNDTLMRDLSFAYIAAKRMPAIAAVIDRARHALAAPPKPDTDTPVDPGVDRNVEAIALNVAESSGWKPSTDNYARIYQAARAGAIATFRAIKPIAGMDANHAALAWTLRNPWSVAGGEPREGLPQWALDLMKRAAAALAAKPIAGMDAGEVETDVQYEVWQDDMLVASSDSEREGRHYLAVYGQDGPAILKLATTTRKILATNQEDGK